MKSKREQRQSDYVSNVAWAVVFLVVLVAFAIKVNTTVEPTMEQYQKEVKEYLAEQSSGNPNLEYLNLP